MYTCVYLYVEKCKKYVPFLYTYSYKERERERARDAYNLAPPICVYIHYMYFSCIYEHTYMIRMKFGGY